MNSSTSIGAYLTVLTHSLRHTATRRRLQWTEGKINCLWILHALTRNQSAAGQALRGALQRWRVADYVHYGGDLAQFGTHGLAYGMNELQLLLCHHCLTAVLHASTCSRTAVFIKDPILSIFMVLEHQYRLKRWIGTRRSWFSVIHKDLYGYII